MAAVNGVEESYRQFIGTSSTSCFVGQLTGTANDENGIKKEDSHGESPHSSVLDTAGSSKNNEKYISNTEHEKKAKRRTSKISDCKLHLNSPSERESRRQSPRKSRSPSGSSSSGSQSRSRTYCSRSRSSSRSASRSSRYRRRYKRSSRSSSRSRSRSLGSRYRRHRSRSHRRHHRSPKRYNRSRSRSRSHVRVSHRRYRSRSRSRSCSRGRRHYGFVHRPRPATFRSWRSGSKTRSLSRSRSRLHLTEKDRHELLEIAKANAAKTLGKSVDLPPSLKKDSWLSDTLHRSLEVDLTKLNKQSRSSNNTVLVEVSPQKGANVSSTDSTVVHPALDKLVNSLGSSQKKEEPKKARGQWIPIQCQRSLNRPR